MWALSWASGKGPYEACNSEPSRRYGVPWMRHKGAAAMTGRRRRFERALSELDAQDLSIDECVEHYATDDPELASMLRLAAAVRAAQPLGDLQPLRTRVETALLAGMDGLHAENDTTPLPGKHARLSHAHAGR